MTMTTLGAGISGSGGPLCCLDVVILIAVVRLANVFLDRPIRTPGQIESNGPGPCVGPRVFERGFDVQIIHARASQLFDDVQLAGMRVAFLIDPGSFIEANGIHNQRSAFPVSDRVSHERRILFEFLFRRMRTPVQKNVTPIVSGEFHELKDSFLFRKLNEFDRVYAASGVRMRPGKGDAERRGIFALRRYFVAIFL